jgi:hypothetical protein
MRSLSGFSGFGFAVLPALALTFLWAAGIHSGPVSGVVDVNERANLAGARLPSSTNICRSYWSQVSIW